MQQWNFRPLVPEDLPWLRRCRDAAAQPFTALSPVSLVTWAETYGLTVAGDEDFYVIHSRHDRGYYAPAGRPEQCAAFEDSPNGIRAAHSAGCHAIMIPDLTPPDDEIRPLLSGVYPDLWTARGFFEGRI